jgi:hypothetical protein
MTAAPPASVRRAVAAAGLAVLGVLAATVSAAPAAGASAAATGQIVWVAGNGIWAMNDDGSAPHELLSAASPPLAAAAPSGTLSEPDVFQAGGTAVLFVDQTSAFADPSVPAACGADCSATFELSNGKLTELGPAARAATGAAYYESQPRLTADGQELFDSSLSTGILAGTPGTTATALVERPLSPHATVTQWSNTNAESEPAAGFDGAPDPADPTEAAWVEAQGCAFHVPNAQNVMQSSCQYAVHFGVAANLAAPVAIYDNEFVSANGRGPTSLALSNDGSTLLLVDPSPPNTGIFTTPVAGVPGQKPVTEVLAQPAGWTFSQARYAGANIVFDAHQQVNGKTTGDIYTVPATCSTSTGCTFPASARNLTNNAAADNSDPAWTSALTPIAALHAAAGARIAAAGAPAAAVRAGRSVELTVKLTAAATIVVRVAVRTSGSSHSHTLGSFTTAGRAGSNTVSFKRIAGRALAPGGYTATISLRGVAGPQRTLHFTVIG